MKAIVNVNRDWAIGRNNELLINIPEDMKYFRSVTGGKTVVMGRKTLESFPGRKPLKGRINIVLTRDPNRIPDESKAAADVVIHADSLEAASKLRELIKERTAGETTAEDRKPGTALVIVPDTDQLLELLKVTAPGPGEKLCEGAEESLFSDAVYVIGGASVYEKLLPYCDFCLVTVNDYDPPADAPADSWFPNLDADPGWVKIRQGDMKESEGVHFCFCEYAKRMDPPAVASDL